MSMKVAVQFRGNDKEYIYNTTFLNHVVGDMVVVDSPHDGLVVVAVSRIEVTKQEAKRGTKFVVAQVDMAEHVQRGINDERKAELKLSIEGRVRAAQARKLITDVLGLEDAEVMELEAIQRGDLDYNPDALIGEIV